MNVFSRIAAYVSSAVVFALTGSSAMAQPSTVPLSGVVQTGGTYQSTPLSNVRVTLYEATTGQPTVLGHTKTDVLGQFVIQSPESASSSILFVTADVGNSVEFVNILGATLPQFATINELTTVAASYSMAQFYRSGSISGSPFQLQLAAGMNDNLVVSATGQPSAVLLASPNADETISLRSTRSLANLLAACVKHPAVTADLLTQTWKPGDLLAPLNTAQALANLARNPGQNVASIFKLAMRQDAYEPALISAPDAWTVTVKVNDSGNDKYMFGGPGNIIFDSRGYAWITNNVAQGTPFSGTTLMVLKPNGKPSDGTNGTPLSPLTSGGLLGEGYGITFGPNNTVWAGNFGWGNVNPTPTGNGSLSIFSLAGAPLTPSNGLQAGPVRAQGMGLDASGNVWVNSWGTDSVYVFPGGAPNQAVSFQQYTGSEPFGLAVAPDGTAWVTNGGVIGQNYNSVAKYKFVNGALQQQFVVGVGKALKGLSVDSQGNAWVTSQLDSSIYALKPDGTLIGRFTGGGINGPWGSAVDGEGNVWVANFGPLAPGSDFTTGALSKLCGATPANCPPGLKTGDPISPASGYTVPSAGSQVLLHNGTPLYGAGGPASYAPIERQTSAQIDQAGNVWTLNNWKPSYNIDETTNPGGDGVIIFVGLAPPPLQRPNGVGSTGH